MPCGGRRLSLKQQRELDAKMHQTLRSLMFSHYVREESTRRSTLLEAQRILSGDQRQNAVLKEEPTTGEEMDDECDLELEPRAEPMEAERSHLVVKNPHCSRSQVDMREPTPSVAVEDRLTYSNGGGLLKNTEIREDVDEYLDMRVQKDESLFDNELTAEQKLELSSGPSTVENHLIDHYPEVQLDVDTEVTMEELKTLSLDDVCIRMAYCAHAASSDGDFKHNTQWYMGMMKTCLEAIATHEYPRPHLPFEVERLLDIYCDKLREDWREEEERNLRKLERRNTSCTPSFDCVYPVSKEIMMNNKLLLTGITGDADLFFSLYFKGVHMKDEHQCYPDCICVSVSYRQANVMHFAAAHGNAEFIKKVLFPGKTLPDDSIIRDHYRTTIYGWVCSAIEGMGTQMYPFDVAVLYDYKDCAREILGYETCAKMLRERKFPMARVKCSLPFREYVESPLSVAVYHGNMDMVKMLQYWQLIKPQHFPQAFREAANAGDLVMLNELWEMSGRNVDLVTEQEAEMKGNCTPLHVAAAAGQLRAVQFLCHMGEALRTKPDAAGDLPLTYAIENGHMAIAEFLMKTFPHEVNHTVIRSAIACKRNRVAKILFHDMLDLKEVIDDIRPLKFAVDTENFHCAEYFLRQYMLEKKINESPWQNDVGEALDSVLRCRTLSPEMKTKFVIAFQLAGVKISMVKVLKTVSDRTVASLICNSLRNNSNQPKT
ncbi:hypothetical protein RB195_000054 [Necator americanus]|uniref:Ankyrin repeat protein n=1 Tax=Necator americanus TaxID=51031 RepID=A0ABR1DAR8_NECAM